MATRKPKPRAIEYNPICDPKAMHGYKNVRWVENASRGLRLVGFADEIARKEHSRAIKHMGWFTDDHGDGDKYRGIVYQLPSRGEPRYVYGYADPCNDDCALLCFDAETDKLDAAKAADSFAERFAEEARDYNRAWHAGRRFEDLADEIKESRREALAIGAEMRAAKRAYDEIRHAYGKVQHGAHVQAPTICATLRATVLSLYRSIQTARKERETLIDDFGRQPGFNDA